VNRYTIFFTVLIFTWLLFFTDAPAQTSNLVAYYPFNGNADDESGNGNHGTVMGATLAEDRFGNLNSAYGFDGVDDHISYPTLWSSPPVAITTAAWFKAMQTNDEGKILYHGDNGEFQLISIGDTALGAVHLPSTWYFTYATTIPSNWHFLTGVWEQGESYLLYLDGDLVDSITVPNEPLLDVGPTYQPSIGSYNRTGGAYFWGYLDDIRIYDRALSSDEIDSLFNDGTSSVEQFNEIIPNKFVLHQNYPNPFNPSTTIGFSIPEASFVSLKVFNSLGQEVATLVLKELNVGNYKYDWNAKNFTSGIYFYQLKTKGYVETKKMLLLK
jgi:hypothetical protein